MRAAAVDIGSTWTKGAAFDLGAGTVCAAASTPTTSDDISRGLDLVLRELRDRAGPLGLRVGCSSAAGGLRLVAVGLVPELTVEAARRAALGAGARVLRAYGYQLTRDEQSEIERKAPDLILLAGGTDGGNRTAILENARRISELSWRGPVIVAGNKSAVDEARDILCAGGHDVRVCPNVMPELYRIEVEPVRQAIRETFLDRIVRAKGLIRVSEMLDAPPVPTPAAVMAMAEHYGSRCPGDLMVIDIGGATTDVYSISAGEPTRAAVVVRGLAEPYAKRTVEGDLGVRRSARSVVNYCGVQVVAGMAGADRDEVYRWLAEIEADPGALSGGSREAIDTVIACRAISVAVDRHVGRIELVPTVAGDAVVQYGKDLGEVGTLVGTGGPFAHSGDPRAMFGAALFDPEQPLSLRPRAPLCLVDRSYLMARLGLLLEHEPELACRLFERSLVAA